MNIIEAKAHADATIVPEPIVTVRAGLPCVGTRHLSGFEGEVLVTAPTFEAAFQRLGEVCPPAYLPIPVSAYAGTPWRQTLEAHLARERAAGA